MSKYDFRGIKEKGAAGIKAALLTSPSTSWMLKVPFITTLIEMGLNWAANKGLIILNIGAIYVEGEIDSKRLDRAMEEGLKKIENAEGKLTPEQIKEIDDAVIKAARKALPYVRAK